MRKPAKPFKVPMRWEYRPIIEQGIKRAARVAINRDYDVPYLAGYNKAGTVVYIDRHMPESMTYKGRVYPVDRLLAVHECVEKMLEMHFKMKYLPAHKLATDAEAKAVAEAGLPWDDYDKFMQKYVKKMGSERITSAPPDLDLQPYRDEGDVKDMAKLQAAMVKNIKSD